MRVSHGLGIAVPEISSRQMVSGRELSGMAMNGRQAVLNGRRLSGRYADVLAAARLEVHSTGALAWDDEPQRLRP